MNRLRLAIVGSALVIGAFSLSACGNDDDDKASLGSQQNQQNQQQVQPPPIQSAQGNPAAVVPTQLDFGEVKVGEEAVAKTVTLTAGTCATQGCTYSFSANTDLPEGRDLSPDQFAFSTMRTQSDPCRNGANNGGKTQLAAGEVCRFAVKFAPTRAGEQTALVSTGAEFVDSNDLDGPTVQVKGTGVAPKDESSPPTTTPSGTDSGAAPGATAKCAGKKGKKKKKCLKKLQQQ